MKKDELITRRKGELESKLSQGEEKKKYFE
jgi:hypothetical protein